jgi:hypothetical protein
MHVENLHTGGDEIVAGYFVEGILRLCGGVGALGQVFEQVPNAPAEAALAQPNGRRGLACPILATECRDAYAVQLGGLPSAKTALLSPERRGEACWQESRFSGVASLISTFAKQFVVSWCQR